jgi:alanine-glyoxylate transaminase/serine-glyoxylate transaminase/serine-pyruvate transaminase
MEKLLNGIDEVLLMGPGPSCVPGDVYRALSAPTLGHMDPYFIRILDETKSLIQELLGTSNTLTLPISGTGSAGMESCFVNLIEPGDAVLILINGVFGKRMQDVAERLGAKVDTLEFEWGTPVLVGDAEEKIKNGNYKIVALVHAETSTGVKNPVKQIGRIVKHAGGLYIVDAVTSVGGIPVEADEWGVDALYSGSQKCISCPPGLAPVTFSDKAVETIQNRKSKVPNWYLDMMMITQYWEGKKRVYHHTAPVNMIYALYQALQLIFEEGIQNVFARHEESHKRLLSGLTEIGLSMLVEPEYRLPMLNSVRIPETVTDEALIRSRLRDEHNIEIGAGLGPLAGKIWRIGLMGHTARVENVDRLLSALKKVL